MWYTVRDYSKGWPCISISWIHGEVEEQVILEVLMALRVEGEVDDVHDALAKSLHVLLMLSFYCEVLSWCAYPSLFIVVVALLFHLCFSCGSTAGCTPAAHPALLHAAQQHGPSSASELSTQAQKNTQEKHKCCQWGQDGQARDVPASSRGEARVAQGAQDHQQKVCLGCGMGWKFQCAINAQVSLNGSFAVAQFCCCSCSLPLSIK